LSIENTIALAGQKDTFIWTQARAAALPAGGEYVAIMTLSKKLMAGEDVYYDLYQSLYDGNRWTEPEVIHSLKIHEIEGGYRRSMSDMTPAFHARSGKVINIGKSFFYTNDEDPDRSRREIAYAVFDPATKAWGPFKSLTMPERDREGLHIMAPTAGCVQFHIDEDGNIFLPVFFYALNNEQFHGVSRSTFTVQNLMNSDDIGSSVAMTKCSLDGQELTLLELGNTLHLKQGRGIGEPSVIKFQDNYFLTLRSDKSAHVTKSKDGLQFEDLKEWRFDNDSLLGSYNTQQHWAAAGEKLYLVYTRPDGKNDHIFRHRAPLYIAEIDPEKLVVKKSTEQICVPEDGVALGNFGITGISDEESWVVTSEYLRHNSKGKTNRVFVAKMKTKDVNQN
jgi:hypothetical protein